MVRTTGQEAISVSLEKEKEEDQIQIGCAFLQRFFDIANSRLDLLYRIYSLESELYISETPYGKSAPLEVNARGRQEIRYLLVSLLNDVERTYIRVVRQRTVKDQIYLFTNGVLSVKDSSVRYLFVRTLIVEETHQGFSICSETLKIHSENAAPSLLDQAKRKLESFRNDIAFHFPQVRFNSSRLLRSSAMKFKERKIRVRVEDCSILESVASTPVGASIRSSGREQPTKEVVQAGELSAREAMDATQPGSSEWPEANIEQRRSIDWQPRVGMRMEFPKSVSPLTLNDVYSVLPKKTTQPKQHELRLDTPLEEPTEDKCIEENAQKPSTSLEYYSHEDHTPEPSRPPVEAPKQASIETKPFLRIFGTSPEPEGGPLVWELSHDAVLTQLKTYQEVVERMNKTAPSCESNGARTNVPWNERTVYLDNLPRDVHPDSLRRAFEVTFGEIEDDNGIIICSARTSSIAYIVFKNKDSAEAVGRSNSWLKGSKLIIQKYKNPCSTVQSMEHPSDLTTYSRNDQSQISTSVSSDASDAVFTN